MEPKIHIVIVIRAKTYVMKLALHVFLSTHEKLSSSFLRMGPPVLKSSSGKFWPPAVVHFIHDLLTCFKSSLQDEERKKSSSAWFITVIITIKLLTGFKSSLQDELQEFFSEFGPVHQLNILRDKTSGVSRYSITRKFDSL